MYDGLYTDIYLNLYFHFFALLSGQSAALSSATQHAMPPELDGKWKTECLSTRFPLLTLLCANTAWSWLCTMDVTVSNQILKKIRRLIKTIKRIYSTNEKKIWKINIYIVKLKKKKHNKHIFIVHYIKNLSILKNI